MTRASSTRHASLRAIALLAVVVAAPVACTLDVQGLKPSGGAGGSTPTSTSTETTMASGTGGSTMCTPGSIVACYDGPAATQDKGVCKSGQHTCNATGDGFDACINQVLPAMKDDCAAGTDTDCNGTVECGCVPGSIASCYDGMPGTEGKGICKAGQHTCKDDAKTYGACMGQTLPDPENCVTAAIDEDCDGKTVACTGDTEGGASLGVAGSDEVLFAAAADKDGNVLLGGVAGALPSSGGYFAISSGVGVVIKVGLNGGPSWKVAMMQGGGSYSVVRGIASDALGNVFVVGEFRGATSGVNINVNNAGGVDIFLAKLDPGGTTLWAKSFGNVQDQFGYGVAIDKKGNVVITGRMAGAVDFGGGARSGGGSDDLFVAKFDTTGAHQWSKAFGDFYSQTGFGVAITPDNDVVVAGEMGGTLDLEGGISLVSAGGSDAFVAKLDGSDGATKWGRRFGDYHNQTATAVAVGSNGGVAITGSMVGKTDFGGGELDATGLNTDAFVARFHPDGGSDWSHNYGSSGENQVGYSISIDPAQNIAVVGYLKGTMTFGTTVLTDAAQPISGNTDMFVAKLATDGKPIWARSFGDVNDQTAWAVATDPLSNVIFAGTYEGTVSLPPPITSQGGYDAFWGELAP